jgi:pimeloyl-ACP methyl ester carboxylesterase
VKGSVVAVDGSTLYAEVRGGGPALLLIHGGGEDADDWTHIADELRGFTVVTYDRRGNGRSGSEGWPGRGSSQHADDAASLLGALGLGPASLVGSSSGAIVAMRTSIRHPEMVDRCIAWEPAALCQVEKGAHLHDRARGAATRYLEAAPKDWVGAYAAFGRAFVGADADPREPSDGGASPEPRDVSRARSFILDDLAFLSREVFAGPEIRDTEVDIRFTIGADSHPIFGEVARRLSEVSGRDAPIVAPGISHELQRFPEGGSAHIRRMLQS